MQTENIKQMKLALLSRIPTSLILLCFSMTCKPLGYSCTKCQTQKKKEKKKLSKWRQILILSYTWVSANWTFLSSINFLLPSLPFSVIKIKPIYVWFFFVAGFVLWSLFWFEHIKTEMTVLHAWMNFCVIFVRQAQFLLLPYITHCLCCLKLTYEKKTNKKQYLQHVIVPLTQLHTYCRNANRCCHCHCCVRMIVEITHILLLLLLL